MIDNMNNWNRTAVDSIIATGDTIATSIDSTNALSYNNNTSTLVYTPDTSYTTFTGSLQIDPQIPYTVVKIYDKDKEDFLMLNIPGHMMEEITEYCTKMEAKVENVGYIQLKIQDHEIYIKKVDVKKELKKTLKNLGYEIDLKSFIEKVRSKKNES